MTDDPRLAAEQRARVEIDRQLAAAGWAVVDRKELNPLETGPMQPDNRRTWTW